MRRSIRHSIRAALPGWAILLIILGAGVGVISVAPSGSCNVTANVTLSSVQFIIASYYTVNGVSAVTSGYSPILDWATAGFTTGLTASDILTVTVGGHTA